MKILDLGDLNGDLLIFGGPYSNLPALQALRAVYPAMPASHVICTGDVVAYCADAAACVAEMRDWGVTCVAGNCEQQLAVGALDCGCGFEEGTVCDTLSARWFAHASAQIGDRDRAWMADCPDIAVFRHAGHVCAVIHGGVTDIARFIWPVCDDAVFRSEIAALNTALTAQGIGPVDRVFAGHSGIPFDRVIDGVHWINAGVIGMPPHDGGPDTRYVHVDGQGVFEIKNLSYNIEIAYEKMVSSGLNQGYHTGLKTGVWPSEDVLPIAMRRG